LAYKVWAPRAVLAYETSLEEAGQHRLADLTQRLFLGWDPEKILGQVRKDSPRQPLGWQAATGLYDLALACAADIPLFLSDWAPAEYVAGEYEPAQRALDLTFRSHQGEPYGVRIYSQKSPLEVSVNGEVLSPTAAKWQYDPGSGWLTIRLSGSEEKRIQILLGGDAAPLHPYFGKMAR
jgi:hypothetical protein